MATLLSGADRQAETILENLCAALGQQFDVANCFRAYVFGSPLAGGSAWADVDILLVVTAPEVCDRLSLALEPLAATAPLHVTIVLQSEFDELGDLAWGTLHELAVY